VINLYAHGKIRAIENELAARRKHAPQPERAPLMRVAVATGRALQRVGTSMESWATASTRAN
jgi:hypothetical protein